MSATNGSVMKRVKRGAKNNLEPKIESESDLVVTVKSEPTQGSLTSTLESKRPKIQIPQNESTVKVENSMSVIRFETALAKKVEAVAVKHKSTKLLGAHVSAQGGVDRAVEEAASIGCRSFALFLRSSRSWAIKPMEDSTVEKFHAACQKYGYDPTVHILPHASYLINLGSTNPDTLQKSRLTIIDECKRCDRLGIRLYNVHPGSATEGATRESCIAKIAESIDMVHKETKHVTVVIENMSCQGNTIGGEFEELKAIIDLVQDKTRIGVCIDTCHAFAAGYDVTNAIGYEKMMGKFEATVGLKYLRAIHLNDSKGNLGCHLDRHLDIGKGRIGMPGFSLVMNDSRFDGIPMCLETPGGYYAKEMMSLYKLN